MNDLQKAIENRLDISTEEAKRYANIVMDLFGFHDRIIDNMLEQKDRQLFYMLEEQGILNTEREEITIYNGRRWRIHYWSIEKTNILKYSNNARWMKDRDENEDTPDYDNIYSYLPKNMWAARKTS